MKKTTICLSTAFIMLAFGCRTEEGTRVPDTETPYMQDETLDEPAEPRRDDDDDAMQAPSDDEQDMQDPPM